MDGVPEEIDVGAHGLVLRRWRMEDDVPLLAAIDASLPELRPWMPWALEPPTLAAVRAYLEESGVASGFHDRTGEQLVWVHFRS